MSQSRINGIALFEDEEVYHDQKPGWSAYSGALLVGLAGILAMGAGLVVLALVWWYRRNTRYLVTSQRVISYGGWGGDKTLEFRIEDIQFVATDRNLLESLAGGGTVSVATAGIAFGISGFASTIDLAGLSDHQHVANTIRQLQREDGSSGRRAAEPNRATAD